MTDTQIDMNEDFQPHTKPKPRAWKRYAPVAVIIVGLGLGYAFGLNEYFSLSFLGEQRVALKSYVNANYATSIIAFSVLYALAVAFSFPAASILTIFGGFLFGWFAGGIAVAFAATTGASGIFLVARSSFGKTLRAKFGDKVNRFAEGFERDAFSYLLILRLTPVPFFLSNIAPAFFDVKLRTYVAATFLGILPGVFAYAFLGSGVESLLIAADKSGTELTAKDLVTPEITIALFAVLGVALIPIIIKKLRAL